MDTALDEPTIAYSLSQYLLDRINIHDTIARLSAYSDCRDFERLGNEVFASSGVTMDNSLITNEEPQSRPAKEEVESYAKYLERFTAAQHVMTCILVNLPQPATTWNIATPNKATASANALVTFRRDRARGETIAQHGSYYTFDLIRQRGMDPGSNPWRISHMKAHPFWFRGNMDVMN
ncbi:hypothetical protein JVT61DRAFT_6508 [Boletus reticuloceps]|uniref:SnoaL-like domain-containing protein n=1 Tax=Boletus reticuloceps TaxID=495285 RepID=A0A8I2YK16_9AGAM|nr:hypothetical protein JVT61DRAFT_6508 [Boletus reticuloceps]